MIRHTLAVTVLSLLAVAFAAPLSERSRSAAPTSLYVSPTGSDSNDGKSASTPLATLPAAQMAARAVLKTASGQRDGVTVNLAEGNYSLAAPLTFTTEDSGSADAPVTWVGEKAARISGGVRVSGWTSVPGPGDVKLVKARFPDDKATATFKGSKMTNAGFVLLQKMPAETFPAGGSPEFVYPQSCSPWTEPRCAVDGVSDQADGTTLIAMKQRKCSP
jgi:hypothetical protein